LPKSNYDIIKNALIARGNPVDTESPVDDVESTQDDNSQDNDLSLPDIFLKIKSLNPEQSLASIAKQIVAIEKIIPHIPEYKNTSEGVADVLKTAKALKKRVMDATVKLNEVLNLISGEEMEDGSRDGGVLDDLESLKSKVESQLKTPLKAMIPGRD